MIVAHRLDSLAGLHLFTPNEVKIRNSIIVGSMNVDNCSNRIDFSQNAMLYPEKARMRAPLNRSGNSILGRAGIIFPTISSKENLMPTDNWTEPRGYASSKSNLCLP